MASSFLLVTSVRQAFALRTVVSTTTASRSSHFLSVGCLQLRSNNMVRITRVSACIHLCICIAFQRTGGRRHLNTSAVFCGDQEGAPHFRRSSVPHPLAEELKLKLDDEHSYTLPHPIWSKEEAEAVKVTHIAPVTKTDKVRKK